jgi:hypothetical protein
VVTVQFVRFIAYTTFVARRHTDAGQSRKHRAAGIREQADPGLSGPGQIIPEGDTMSTVTMQDLELESAELLPARETLCRSCYQPSNSFSQGGILNGPILSGNAVAVTLIGNPTAVGGGNEGFGNL